MAQSCTCFSRSTGAEANGDDLCQALSVTRINLALVGLEVMPSFRLFGRGTKEKPGGVGGGEGSFWSWTGDLEIQAAADESYEGASFEPVG